jgi:MFS transporter, YNFM family, putative membrane transport protein
VSTDDAFRLRRIRIALLMAALALFALLYAPQPVLPQLSVAFSVTPAVVTLLVSAATFGVAIAALPLGTLSEAVGRRRTMVVSLVTAEVLGLVLPWVHNFPVLVVIRFAEGAAVAGVAAAAVAYLAEESGGERMGTTLGLYVAGTTIGGMSGRILGGIVGDSAGWESGEFAVAALAGVCTILFVMLLPTERRQVRQALRWSPLFSGLRTALRDPVLYAPYAVAFLGMSSFVTIYNVLGFRLTAPPLLVPPALAALAFLAYGAGTVTSATAGRLADRQGRTIVLLACMAVTVAGLLLMFVNILWLIIVGLVVFTGGFFASHSVANGWVGSRAPAASRGQAAGLYQFSYYAGSSVGGLLGGAAYTAWGWSGMTVLLLCWLAMAAAGVVLARPAMPDAGGNAPATSGRRRGRAAFRSERR